MGGYGISQEWKRSSSLPGYGKTKSGRYYFLPRDFRYEDKNLMEKSGLTRTVSEVCSAMIPDLESNLPYRTTPVRPAR